MNKKNIQPWNRYKFDNFMTEKEKNYVAHIFRKKINTIHKIYNYEIFFEKKENKNLENTPSVKEIQIKMNSSGNKMLIDEIKGIKINPKNAEFDNTKAKDEQTGNKQNQKMKKISFVKSVKLPRLMVESNLSHVEDIAIKLEIENMIDEFICKKYNIRECKLQKLIQDASEKIHEFFKVSKFRKLIQDILEDDDNETKQLIILVLLKKSHLIIDDDKTSDFFDYLVSFIPKLNPVEIRKIGFFENFVFNLTGVLLATLLLINQEELAPIFYNTIQSRMEYLLDVKPKFVWRFLAILAINLSDNEKKWMIRRLKDRIVQVALSNDENSIQDMGLFLDALGLNSDDLK